jgi:Tfp pilus assembly protein PilF
MDVDVLSLQAQPRGAGPVGRTTDERIAYFSKLSGDAHSRVLLALEYLQKMRETGDARYLKLAAENVASLTDNLEARRVHNEIGLMQHRFRDVAKSAEELVALEPSDTGSWGNLGDARMELGEYNRAAEAYQKMLSLRPNLASYNRAAYFHFVTGNAPMAISLMKNAIEAGSKVPEQVAWCWSELGDMYYKTGSLDQARISYRSALQLHPALHKAQAGMGRLLANQGKLSEAIASFQRAQSVVPLPEYIAALEDLYSDTSQEKKARDQRQLLEAVSTLARANGDKANRILALIYVDHGRKPEAALQLVQDEFENRGDVYTYDALGWVLYKLKRIPEAEAAAAKALRFETPEPTFYFHAGMIAAGAGKQEDADRLLKRALELNPTFDRKQAALARNTISQ